MFENVVFSTKQTIKEEIQKQVKEVLLFINLKCQKVIFFQILKVNFITTAAPDSSSESDNVERQGKNVDSSNEEETTTTKSTVFINGRKAVVKKRKRGRRPVGSTESMTMTTPSTLTTTEESITPEENEALVESGSGIAPQEETKTTFVIFETFVICHYSN